MIRDIATFGANTELVEALTRRGARFLVVGGCAMRYHVPTRIADDLDLLIEPTANSAAAVIAALSECPLISTSNLDVERMTQPQKIQIPVKIHYHADILKPANDFNFEKHWEQAADAMVGHTIVKVASRDTLREFLICSNEEKHNGLPPISRTLS